MRTPSRARGGVRRLEKQARNALALRAMKPVDEKNRRSERDPGVRPQARHGLWPLTGAVRQGQLAFAEVKPADENRALQDLHLLLLARRLYANKHHRLLASR